MNSKSIFLRCFALCIPLWIVCESSTLQEDILKQEEMDKSVHDILDEPLEEEGRLFFNFDRGAAFNTSVAFTIPLFSFTLPGAAETAATGLDANSFGVLAFVALFLLGGLGVSIYTTSQGGNEDGVEVLRGFGETNYFNNRLLNRVYDSLFELPEVLNVESCTQLCICSAHAEPERYGILAWPIRILVPTSQYIKFDYPKSGCSFESDVQNPPRHTVIKRHGLLLDNNMRVEDFLIHGRRYCVSNRSSDNSTPKKRDKENFLITKRQQILELKTSTNVTTNTLA
ncbi:hypothetical protein Avbf_10055 [Armadillidium vulgare]|nr:hypothetical protein Avbf_10055 [Armadillidium vulgare]